MGPGESDFAAFLKSNERHKPLSRDQFPTPNQCASAARCHPSINQSFTPGSRNTNIRSGVGIGMDGSVVFGLSQLPMKFHDFAAAFLKDGCSDELYLDGAISLFHTPERPAGGIFWGDHSGGRSQ